MTRALRCLVVVAVAMAFAPGVAPAFTRSQHGGRGAAQAGALLARADDPSAVRYDPAGLAALDGLRLQVGLDFQVVDLEADGPGGTADALHEIQFPPALYLSWKPSSAPRWTFGAGVDAPLWSLVEWPESHEPGNDALASEATLLEGRVAAAWDAGAGWSLGAAARWLSGSREQERLAAFPLAGAPEPARLVERVDSTVDGAGFELAVRRSAERWGAAVVWTSRVELDGDAEGTYAPLDAGTAGLPGLADAYPPYAARHELALPESLAAGIWLAAGDRTRVELDVALARWSGAGAWRAVDAGGAQIPHFSPSRAWRDTTSLRAGVEHRLASGWRLGAGIAREESPVADSADYELPYGDATIASFGASYDFPRLGFDLGGSFHDGDTARSASGESFRGSGSAFSVSARWRLDRGE